MTFASLRSDPIFLHGESEIENEKKKVENEVILYSTTLY